MSERVVRVAAKGDGVSESGRHVAFAAPGDTVAPDGTLLAGPHHAVPPCRHFPRCGGCQLQHLDEETLARFVHDRVANAASGQDIPAALLRPAYVSPPRTRRRATLRAVNGGGRAVLGFSEQGSHKIVDMRECHILHPALFALVDPLRTLLSRRRERYAADVSLTLTDQGVDCGIAGLAFEGLDAMESLLDFCRGQGLARMTLDHGYGAEAVWEPQPVTVTLSGIAVGFPPGGFLQATADGEQALVGAAVQWLADTRAVVDLFAGLGTFAFGLAGGRRVTAVEAARDAHLACRAAAGRAGLAVEAVHRDLFRNPLRPEELAGFDAAVLDPPRAGAREQVMQLARSAVSKIVYISCNPSSWARDARMLADAGFRLVELRPIGQFRWSTHVELASLFVR